MGGNGIIHGNVFNAGLIRIPIVALPQVYGGHVEIPLPIPVPGPIPTPPAPMVSPDPIIIHQETIATIGGGSSGGGVTISPPIYTIDASVIPVKGTFSVDASLEVTGSYLKEKI